MGEIRDKLEAAGWDLTFEEEPDRYAGMCIGASHPVLGEVVCGQSRLEVAAKWQEVHDAAMAEGLGGASPAQFMLEVSELLGAAGTPELMPTDRLREALERVRAMHPEFSETTLAERHSKHAQFVEDVRELVGFIDGDEVGVGQASALAAVRKHLEERS